MKQTKRKEIVKLLESYGFVLIRSNGHLIYGLGTVRIALSHDRMVAPGVVRQVYKAIELTQVKNAIAA